MIFVMFYQCAPQMESEIATLRSENERLRMAEAAAVRRAVEAERELQRMRPETSATAALLRRSTKEQ